MQKRANTAKGLEPLKPACLQEWRKEQRNGLGSTVQARFAQDVKALKQGAVAA